jgi:hypothetical protein
MNSIRFACLVAVFCLMRATTFAQTSSLVVFNELGQDFTLVINGTHVSATPAQHIRVTDLQPSRYHVEAHFVNRTIPDQAVDIQIQAGRETSYALMQGDNGRGPMGFVFLSEFSTGYFPVAPQSALTVAYLGPLTNPNTVVVQPSIVVQPAVIVPQPVPVEPIRPNPLPGYNGPVGCDYPMDATEFEAARATIESKSFSDTKMQLAKQITRTNCLTTAQVVAVMQLFSFESQKLEFAKFAYDYTYDSGNYYKINEAFGFESSVRDLEKYLREK